ncbi:MAG: M56 family metallopeptidase [Oscillospiraceae bacterium]|jgi:beta-lactamase regulating signal transducer with metallopeptidase domain|nr:M56 family metallopeptidase [Oscillospiraceae bacterium]
MNDVWNDFMRALLVMSASGSAAALLLFALKPLVKNRLPKAAQYYQWLIVLAALLIPFSKLVVLPAPSAAAATTARAPAALIYNAVEQYAVTVEETRDRLQQGQTVPSPVQRAPEAAALLSTLLFFVYPFGAALVLGVNLLGYVRFTRRVKRGRSPARPEETALLAALCSDGTGRRVPGLYRSAAAYTPMLMGLFRPTIVLPVRTYSRAQIAGILSHELIHDRRRDVLVKWAGVLACSLHWFNPLVWLTRGETDRACELACDEAVIRRMDPQGRQSYGETLITFAAAPPTPRAVLATTMCEEKKSLKERLRAIMTHKKTTRLAVALAAALLVTVAGAAIVLGAGCAPATPQANPESSASPPAAPETYLYETQGYTLRLPIAFKDNVIFTNDAYQRPSVVTVIYANEYYNAATGETWPGNAYILSIVRSTQAEFEHYFPGTDQMGGVYHFARDADYYYSVETPTDVQSVDPLYRALSEQVGDIVAAFIADNGLAPYDHQAAVYAPAYTYLGEHLLYKMTLINGTKNTYVLSQPVKQGPGGIWCVERLFIDETGQLIWTFPDTDLSAADYYAEIQRQADSGQTANWAHDWLDPESVAQGNIVEPAHIAEATLVPAEGGQ